MSSEQTQRERLERHIYERVQPITCLDGMRVLDCSETSITIATRVERTALNVRGFAHGGWLFSLCDACSGALVFSRGLDCVTQQASINYLRGSVAGETVTARVRALHWGRQTIVNEVTLENGDGVALAVCTLTMFVMGAAQA